jgi:hypothetical protein
MSLFPSTSVSEQIIIPLTKIDVERRMVIGVAAIEQPDLTKEIMDYATAKPAFETWSKSFETATGGLSKGNLRVMHQKTAVGRLDQIAFNDEAKQIEVCAKVVDDNEWRKCLDGVYTGFSVGGGYAKKWKDGDLTRYTPRVAELSLVDSPCMPGARFAELLKADGMVEQIELRGREEEPESFGALWKRRPETVPTFADAWAKRPMTFGELTKATPLMIPPSMLPSNRSKDSAMPSKMPASVYNAIKSPFASARLCPTCGQALPKQK